MSNIGRVAALRKCKFFHRLTRTRCSFGSSNFKTDAGSLHVVGSLSLNLAPCFLGRPLPE